MLFQHSGDVLTVPGVFISENFNENKDKYFPVHYTRGRRPSFSTWPVLFFSLNSLPTLMSLILFHYSVLDNIHSSFTAEDRKALVWPAAIQTSPDFLMYVVLETIVILRDNRSWHFGGFTCFQPPPPDYENLFSFSGMPCVCVCAPR
jgi:hypothetical protein